MYPEKMKQKQTLQEREIEVMRSLRHRNVVELLDVVVRTSSDKAAGKAPYMFLVFEYAEGGDFAAYLKAQPGRRLSEAKTRHWMTQLRDGLYFLSQQSILHRDLKPQNLLLSSKDESIAVLKLADFGFARFIHSHSMIETVCGTPLYMAPEILRSEKYEVSSDLWSVGCILYQCLVGRAPFVVSTHYELIKKLEKEEIALPSDVRSQISPECHDLILRLLDKNRDSRIGWDAYFRHPWFGGASIGGTGGPLSSMEASDLSSSSSGSRSSLSGATHFPMDGLTPATIIQQHEAAGRTHRLADRALAVLELADMKGDHGKRDDASVLYRRGLECLAEATAVVKAEPREEWTDALLDRLKIKTRIYQERATRSVPHRRASVSMQQQQRAPSELMLEFALQMGRDGGVSEILGDFQKADKLYSNGCVILEQLLTWAVSEDDKALLADALQRFVQRIVHVNELMETADD